MVYKVKWSKKASFHFDQVIDYLRENWSEKSAEKFTEKLLKKIYSLREMPKIGKIYKGQIRELVIVKQCSVFYELRGDIIVILTVFDNRQDPQKKKF